MDHMQICTSLRPDNLTGIPPLEFFLQAKCRSPICHQPTASEHWKLRLGIITRYTVLYKCRHLSQGSRRHSDRHDHRRTSTADYSSVPSDNDHRSSAKNTRRILHKSINNTNAQLHWWYYNRRLTTSSQTILMGRRSAGLVGGGHFKGGILCDTWPCWQSIKQQPLNR